MRIRVWLASVGLWAVLVLPPGLGWGAGLPVVDAALNALGIQQFAQQLKDYGVMLKQLANEAEMIKNQLMQVQYAYTTVQHGVQNLTHLDLNNAQSVMGLVNTLEGKMAQIDQIGYSVEYAVGNVTRLYPRVLTSLDAAGQRALKLSWADAQRENSRIAVQVQAIRENKDLYRDRWTDLLNKAYAAQGAKDVGQANVQALGLVGVQLVNVESQLATIGRELSTQNLRATTQLEMEERANEVTGQAMDTNYTASGKRLAMPRTR